MIFMTVAVGREILENQQGEMDFLLTQQRDTKRDSRLVRDRRETEAERIYNPHHALHFFFPGCLQGFLYDLEKVDLDGSFGI